MFQIDNENFGSFLSTLRKEKGLTQKELAQKLFVSDKAVSKWERGLSMPDISLLLPLSSILGVTTTELLHGSRMEESDHLDKTQVETLVAKTIELSEEKQSLAQKEHAANAKRFLTCTILMLLELLLLRRLGYSPKRLLSDILTVELLTLLLGLWFCFFAKESLPTYYDENKISAYSDGIFRMNLPGVHFNNSNWPHIKDVGQKWSMAVFSLFPLFYLFITSISPILWQKGALFFTLASALSIFIPLYIVGKKYE